MASVSWPSVTAAPDGTTIGFNSSGLLTVLQAPKLVLPSGISIQQDSSNHMGFFNGSTEFEILDGAGHHVFANTNSSTEYPTFEIVTNGTINTLTGTSYYMANYPPYSSTFSSPNMILYGSQNTISATSTSSITFGTAGPIALGDYQGAGPFVIYNVGAFTAQSAFSAVNLSASYSTTSTTAVSTGLGTAKIVVSSFTVNHPMVVSFEGYGYNNTLGDGVTLSLYVSTAGVPAQGSAPPSTDTLLTSITVTQEGLASNPYSMPITYVYTPTATGNYYFYIAVTLLRVARRQ